MNKVLPALIFWNTWIILFSGLCIYTDIYIVQSLIVSGSLLSVVVVWVLDILSCLFSGLFWNTSCLVNSACVSLCLFVFSYCNQHFSTEDGHCHWESQGRVWFREYLTLTFRRTSLAQIDLSYMGLWMCGCQQQQPVRTNITFQNIPVHYVFLVVLIIW